MIRTCKLQVITSAIKTACFQIRDHIAVFCIVYASGIIMFPNAEQLYFLHIRKLANDFLLVSDSGDFLRR